MRVKALNNLEKQIADLVETTAKLRKTTTVTQDTVCFLAQFVTVYLEVTTKLHYFRNSRSF